MDCPAFILLIQVFLSINIALLWKLQRRGRRKNEAFQMAVKENIRQLIFDRIELEEKINETLSDPKHNPDLPKIYPN